MKCFFLAMMLISAFVVVDAQPSTGDRILVSPALPRADRPILHRRPTRDTTWGWPIVWWLSVERPMPGHGMDTICWIGANGYTRVIDLGSDGQLDTTETGYWRDTTWHPSFRVADAVAVALVDYWPSPSGVWVVTLEEYNARGEMVARCGYDEFGRWFYNPSYLRYPSK